MQPIIVNAIAAASLMITSGALAVEMPALAKKNGCTGCHAIDRKVVGPAWQAVADKYKGSAGAANMLIAKITKGGSGVWGKAAMPANPRISEADKKELVDFVLSLSK
ncbi:MAG: cytochrome C [Nitrosomonadales bacterium]|nr:cytochrome C [Nitrosomonadales bacterium]